MSRRRGPRCVARLLAPAVAAMLANAMTAAAVEDLPRFVGPAMGTTYGVTLAAPIPGMSPGAVHRELEAVLARIDRAASTWREDSDASRFNRADAGAWIEVSDDLVAIVEIAREVHEASDGAFDITAARAGLGCVETRAAAVGRPAAIRKTRDAIALDLGGIGPGYAVDRLGERLLELGSAAHLVELGGEVRGWGRPAGRPAWRVRTRGATSGAEAARVIELAGGTAVAASTLRPGRSPIDPRTGRPVSGSSRTVTVRADSCARADAWAVAAIVLGLVADGDGTIRAPPPAPSRPAGPPATRRAVP
jgi:thiamine biosynthesis lipoprotein